MTEKLDPVAEAAARGYVVPDLPATVEENHARSGHWSERRPYYAVDVKGQTYQAWDLATAIVGRLPVDLHVAHPLCIALEYICRAGLKKSDVRKDLEKARAALDRAIEELP